MDQDIKFAVIGATYHRKNGKTSQFLKHLFNCLNSQTYQNFKVFLIGDDYVPEGEFETLCSTFPAEKIYYKNHKGISYRNGVFRKPQNKWTSGGTHAKYIGIKQAIAEGFKYYLHFDDDDTWFANHIEEHYLSIKKYPQVDFQFTISRYLGGQLPRKADTARVKQNGYNNMIPRPCNIVHSTWCINLDTVGPRLLQFFEQRMNAIENLRRNRNVREPEFGPMDAGTLTIVGNHVRKGLWKSVFIPKITCNKATEGNIPS